MAKREKERLGPYVFISYAHQDAFAYDLVVKMFDKNGVRYWSDDFLDAGADWNLEIATHIRNAEVCLLLLSSGSAVSSYVKDELNFAKKYRKPIHTLVIGRVEIPDDIELMIGRMQMIKMSGDYQRSLMKALPNTVFQVRQNDDPQWNEHHAVRCDYCGGTMFRLHPVSLVPICGDCGKEKSRQNIPAKKVVEVESVLPEKTTEKPSRRRIKAISAAADYVAALFEDGTVRCVGSNAYRAREAENWTEITAIAAGSVGLVGLKQDGTIVSTMESLKAATGNWRDITAIAVNGVKLVALKRDGTVISTGENIDKEVYDLSDWTGIVAIAVAWGHTVGLRQDGTVVAKGNNVDGVCDVDHWRDIVAIEATFLNTYGVKRDGTVVVAGCLKSDDICMLKWTDISRIVAIHQDVIGIKADGTVVSADNYEYRVKENGLVKGWSSIKDVGIPKSYHYIGLKQDGTLIGYEYYSETSYVDKLMAMC